MRLLLLERCDMMCWLMRRLVPADVVVERVETFEEARCRLREHVPDAAVFDLTPCVGPWRELAELCEIAEPRIPFRWTSADESLLDTLHIPAAQRDRFLRRPMPVESLRGELATLLGEAGGDGTTAAYRVRRNSRSHSKGSDRG